MIEDKFLTRRELAGFIIAIVAFIAAAMLPVLNTGIFFLSLGVTIAMYTVLSTSWALFSGPTHYISLATAAFFGLGMYVVGSGIEVLPFPILAIIATCAGAVLLLIAATLRLSGIYFVIFTLGLAEFIRQIVTWVQTTMGTSSGLYVLINIEEKTIYWRLLCLAAFVYLIGWGINRSRLGFALRIIGNDEEVAKHSGINVALVKVLLFMICGSIAALISFISTTMDIH